MRRTIAIVALLLAPVIARADDFGPPRDLGAVRADARVLLAHHARLAKIDPMQIGVSDVVVAGDQALVSWSIGMDHGVMGLVRSENRWWDALDATAIGTGNDCWSIEHAYPLTAEAPIFYEQPSEEILSTMGFGRALTLAAGQHNAIVQDADASVARWHEKTAHHVLAPLGCQGDIYEVQPHFGVHRRGGSQAPDRRDTSGYAVTLHYTPNDAQPDAKFEAIRVRPPTQAEFLPYPTPFDITAEAVMFFDFGVEGPKPVSFQRGSSFDVWFPFVLDDTLKYSMVFSAGRTSVGPIAGTIFDNVLHFDLPAFTAVPGETFMGEIDGGPH